MANQGVPTLLAVSCVVGSAAGMVGALCTSKVQKVVATPETNQTMGHNAKFLSNIGKVVQPAFVSHFFVHFLSCLSLS